MDAPRPHVLFLTSDTEDYLSDGLFHGLRTLLGDRVVDHPKREIMYRTYAAPEKLYGRGFTLYGLLDDVPVDRALALDRVRRGFYDLVVFGDIWRHFGYFVELLPYLGQARVAFLDGADQPAPYPYGRAFWQVPQWWALPRAHKRGVYFKRELTEETAALRAFKLLPRSLARRLPFAQSLQPLAFSIPEEKITPGPSEKSKLFAAHVVDEEVAARLNGTSVAYAFEREEDYYADLRESRFGITTKRAGWDALRHYELAANGCVPCFRGLRGKPPRCAPHGLQPGVNCLAYEDAGDLFAQVESVRDYERLRDGALRWAQANSTRQRALEFLRVMGVPVRAPETVEAR